MLKKAEKTGEKVSSAGTSSGSSCLVQHSAFSISTPPGLAIEEYGYGFDVPT
jgi:hypothetical protein